MSTTKRRKLDAQVPPQSAVSAISALAARRRLASIPSPADPSSSTESEGPTPTPARINSFSVLQNLNSKNESSKVRAPERALGTNARKAETRSPQKPSTDSEVNTPRDDPAGSRISYSSFILSRNNCRRTAAGAIQLRLREGERFLVLGSYGIKVLTGQVTISGATLQPSDQIHWVHAPQCYAVPVLRTVEKSSLELHNDPNSHGLRRLDRLSPLFRKLWNEGPQDMEKPALGMGSTFQIVCSSDEIPDRKSVISELSSPPEWNKKLSDLMSSASGGGVSPSITLICGPKSSGKSTFSRLLANRLLTQQSAAQKPSRCGVALLDLDPGQPEFTPSGAISLIQLTQPNLGVPFTHPSLHDSTYRVIRCHALAAITPASAPEHYLECTLDLLATYHQTLKHSHLLINTPGWILGTGLDLLTEITRRVAPSEVIYMSEDGPAETVDGLQAATKKKFALLPSQPSENVSRTAIHLRTMSNMSYFHIDKNGTSDRLQWNPPPLTTMPPMSVRYSGPRSGIVCFMTYDQQPPPELLADSINGTIVAAVEIESPQAFRQSSPAEVEENTDLMQKLGVSVSVSPEGIPYLSNPNGMTLDPRHSNVVGLVLIRGIDVSTKSLQVLTPIPPRKLHELKSQGRDIVFVHGKFDTPTWAYTEDFYERSGQDEAADKVAENGAPGLDNSEGQEEEEEEEEEEELDEEQVMCNLDAPVSALAVGSNVASPWVEVLQGNEKRPIGSRTWRVRRDLGRSQGD